MLLAARVFQTLLAKVKNQRVKKFIQNWAVNTLAVLVAVYTVPGVKFKDNSLWTPFVTSLVLGILNVAIRRYLLLLALPLLIFTLGLFILVIDACLLYFVSMLLNNHFEVRSFWSALLGALVINLVSLVLNSLTGTGESRVRIQRHRPPPSSKTDGGGPVIDV
jgi:putative membrane protein